MTYWNQEIDYIKWDMKLQYHQTWEWKTTLKPRCNPCYILGLYDGFLLDREVMRTSSWVLLRRWWPRWPRWAMRTSRRSGRGQHGRHCQTSDPANNGSSHLLSYHFYGAHISRKANHQMGRMTPLENAWSCGHMGNLGYELISIQSSARRVG